MLVFDIVLFRNIARPIDMADIIEALKNIKLYESGVGNVPTIPGNDVL